MSDRGYRLCCILALAPLCVGVAFLFGYIFSDDHPAAAAGVLTMTPLTVWTWRRYVLWTVLRTLSTVTITGLLIAQAFIWFPLVNLSKCDARIMLTHGQNGVFAGGWSIVCGLIWWNGVLWSAGRRRELSGVTNMNGDTARMALAFAMMPLLPGVFFASLAVYEDWFTMQSPSEAFAAYVTSCVVAVAYWLLLWRRKVEWTLRSRWLTGLLSALLLMSPLAVYLAEGLRNAGVPQHNVMYGMLILLPLYALALFLAGTARAWRSRAIDAAAGRGAEDLPRCRQCDYSMVGLREARCPECSWTTTLDDLVRQSMATMSETV